MTARCWRSILVVLIAISSGMAAGCFGGVSNPGYFPWILPHGDVVRTHDRPAGEGYYEDFDPHARRLEVLAPAASAPLGKQLLLIATVYDESDKPRRKRLVKWMIEGKGNIIDVDESGYLNGRGAKIDNTSAYSFTNYFERHLPKGIDGAPGLVIGPGQTWCVVSSAVEGQTIVTAYAPEIADPEKNRILVKVNWVDARWQFPPAASAKAGTDHVFATQVNRHTGSDPVSNYRVRYTILDDGPAAAVYLVSAQKAGTPRTVTVATDAEGIARVNVSELKPEFGSNRIGIEVLKPDPNEPARLIVLARSETHIDWQAPQIRLNIDAPATALLNQTFPITYSVVSTGSVDTAPIIVKAAIPAGCTVVSADPKATQDGNDLLWSLPGLQGNKQHTLQVVFKPAKTGKAVASATVRTDDLRDDKSATVEVNEGRVDISLSGPSSGLVGENLPFQITVTNPGTGLVKNLTVTAQFDATLQLPGRNGGFSTTIDRMEPGQSQAISLPLVPTKEGRSGVKATVIADGDLKAETAVSTVDLKKPDLKVSVTGPPRGYLNQEATWTVRVFNPTDLPLGDVKLRAVLPPEVTFRSAGNDGAYLNGAVEWNIGTTLGKQWTDVTMTGVCSALSARAVVAATVGGTPLDKRGGEFLPVALAKPVDPDKAESSIEILGVPSLQLDVADSADPVEVGQKIVYTIRVKNAGTLAASKVDLSVNLPPQVKASQVSGASKGTIDGQKVTFASVNSILPGLESVFTIETDAVTQGDGRIEAQVQSLSMGSPIRTEEMTRVLGKKEVAANGR